VNADIIAGSNKKKKKKKKKKDSKWSDKRKWRQWWSRRI